MKHKLFAIFTTLLFKAQPAFLSDTETNTFSTKSIWEYRPTDKTCPLSCACNRHRKQAFTPMIIK